MFRGQDEIKQANKNYKYNKKKFKKVCYKKKIRKELRYWCPTCKVPLCVPCFREYHNLNF